MKQEVNPIANNLKRIREERGLSLDKTADLTGVSKSMLRQIEIGQSSPTIATIWKIANGLHVPFTALLKEAQQEVSIVAFKQEQPLFGDSSAYRVYPVVPFSPERPYEIYYMELDPGATLHAEPHAGDAREHIFVTEGEIEITIGGKTYAVHTGQAITFQADVDHGYKNVGEDTLQAVMTISYVG